MTDASPVAIILAAGKGTRMKSDLPKVLCRAGQRPLIHYVLDALREAGVSRLLCVVGYRSDLVRRELRGEPDVEFIEQEEQLGTGHAVMVCRQRLAHHRGPVLVVTGDSPMLQSDTVRQLLSEYERESAACVMGTLIHDSPDGLGRIVRDQNGEFVGIVEEKDATEEQKQIREVNMSTYVFACQPLLSCLDRLTTENRQREYYVTDVPGIMIQQGLLVRALPVLKPVEALSVNTAEDLERVESELRRSE